MEIALCVFEFVALNLLPFSRFCSANNCDVYSVWSVWHMVFWANADLLSIVFVQKLQYYNIILLLRYLVICSPWYLTFFLYPNFIKFMLEKYLFLYDFAYLDSHRNSLIKFQTSQQTWQHIVNSMQCKYMYIYTDCLIGSIATHDGMHSIVWIAYCCFHRPFLG